MSLRLADQWLERAIRVGNARHDYADQRDYINYGVDPNGVRSRSINGAVAECGVGKHFKQKWHENIGVLTGIDVGEIIEVRSRPPGGDLGIRPARKTDGSPLDKHMLPHVLVWVYEDDNYRMELQGWLYGFEGAHEVGGEKHKRRWNEASKCWYNPPPYRPLDELARIIADPDEVSRILERQRNFQNGR